MRSICELTLRIWHPSSPSQNISDALDLIPEQSFSVGDNRVTRGGRKLAGIYQNTLWIYEILLPDNYTLSGLISHANAILGSRKGEVRSIIDSGGKVEYFSGIFTNSNIVEVFDHELLRECSELGVEISISIFPGRS
jgi:hypothetical protein